MQLQVHAPDLNKVGDVQGVDEAQPFLHAALTDQSFDHAGEVEAIAPVRRFEPEMFSQRFHACGMSGG